MPHVGEDTDDRRSGPPLGQREYNLKNLNETRDDGEHSSIPVTPPARGVLRTEVGGSTVILV